MPWRMRMLVAKRGRVCEPVVRDARDHSQPDPGPGGPAAVGRPKTVDEAAIVIPTLERPAAGLGVTHWWSGCSRVSWVSPWPDRGDLAQRPAYTPPPGAQNIRSCAPGPSIGEISAAEQIGALRAIIKGPPTVDGPPRLAGQAAVRPYVYALSRLGVNARTSAADGARRGIGVLRHSCIADRTGGSVRALMIQILTCSEIVFGLGRHLDAPTAGHELEFLGAVRVPEGNPAGGGPVPGPTAGTAGHMELYIRSMQEVRRFTPSTVPLGSR